MNKGKAPNIAPIVFYMFLCVSDLRSFQAMYLKFAEHVDILQHFVFAKFKIDRGRKIGIPCAQKRDLLKCSHTAATGDGRLTTCFIRLKPPHIK